MAANAEPSLPMIILQVIESLAVVAATLVAVLGIGSWRAEVRGRREYELAEEVLALFYEAKDRIKFIRNPWTMTGEGRTRKPREGEPEEAKDALDQAHVVFERYDKCRETFLRLHTLRFRFMATFGAEYEKPFEDLSKVVGEIFSAVAALGILWRPRFDKFTTPEQDKERMAVVKEHEEVIWRDIGDPDETLKSVDDAIAEIEPKCRQILERKPGWLDSVFGWFK